MKQNFISKREMQACRKAHSIAKAVKSGQHNYHSNIINICICLGCSHCVAECTLLVLVTQRRDVSNKIVPPLNSCSLIGKYFVKAYGFKATVL